MRSRKRGPLLWSLIAGAVLVVAPAVLGLWESLSSINTLAVPGLWIAALRYPEGVHTGSGGSGYVVLATLINFLSYSLLAYPFIRLVYYLRARASTLHESRHEPASL